MTAVDRLGSAWRLYRRTATTRSAILLLLANLVPVVGVLAFGWSLQTILVLYWLENGIVGLWNVPKIIMARGSIMPRLPDLPESAAFAATGSAAGAARLQEQWRQTQAAQAAMHAANSGSASASSATTAPAAPTRSPAGILGPQAGARLSAIPRTGLAIFFAFHYGMFWLVHGIFVFVLPSFAGGAGPFDAGPCLEQATGFPIDCGAGAFGALSWTSVLIGGVALFLSHGASFVLNYIGRGEYLTASPAGQMGSVYGRVVVLHLTIIFGSVLVAFLGSPVGALLVLVVLKTAFDLGLHLRERRKAGPSVPGSAGPAQAAGLPSPGA